MSKEIYEETDLVSEGGADLHTHSFSSDGQYSPRKLVELAEEAGLEALALTDHDTVDGLSEFMRAGQNSPVETVPGLEISCEIHDGRYHVLGYYLDWEKPVVPQKLKYYEESRAERVRKMVELLQQERGINLTFEDVSAQAKNNLLGKPHVARAMVEEGLVATPAEAFEKYLAGGRLLDSVPKERMGVREAVQLIKSAGGIPVLAHPVLYPGEVDPVKFKGMGIEGLEVYYPDNSPEEHKKYLQMARANDLLVVGGTDFHGEVKPEGQLGDIRMDLSLLDRLREKYISRGGRQDFFQKKYLH